VKQPPTVNESKETTPLGILIINAVLAVYAVLMIMRLLVAKGVFSNLEGQAIGALMITVGVWKFHQGRRRKAEV